MKLFEHIQGNEFKLKEMAEFRMISKEEELQGLQYIRKNLIPVAAERWNDWVISVEKKPQNRIDPQVISKNLVKLYHQKSYPMGKDAIFYKSYVRLPGNRHGHTFRFITFIDEDGQLKSMYDYQGDHYYRDLVVAQRSHYIIKGK